MGSERIVFATLITTLVLISIRFGHTQGALPVPVEQLQPQGPVDDELERLLGDYSLTIGSGVSGCVRNRSKVNCTRRQ